MAVSAVAYPVMRITSTSGWISLAARSRSIPLSPGMTRSVRMTSYWARSRRSIPSVPDPASETSHPFSRRIVARRETIAGSSSTTRIRFRTPVMSRFPPGDRPVDRPAPGGQDDHERRDLEVPVPGAAHPLRRRAFLESHRLRVVRGGYGGGEQEQEKGDEKGGQGDRRSVSREGKAASVQAIAVHRLSLYHFARRERKSGILRNSRHPCRRSKGYRRKGVPVVNRGREARHPTVRCFRTPQTMHRKQPDGRSEPEMYYNIT